MSNRQKQLNLLGLATRARNLISGDELVTKAIKQGKVHLVICANDASASTLERYDAMCQRYNVALDTSFSRMEISQAIGKSRSICAMNNQGMANKFHEYNTK
ncbi:L7Ae/L30e/S12e/Gadd45 family ribosomal protein [Fundicoccus culcitae]|uniref:Ribosomal L7Ae/L30e/S12e/Gadd45 family protein n=1 Tax=Fundicoccus culcitae TaxID=2969821 RepID=A0ABY5P7B0_9LACT|nr:ribosomal L7Ae/L30e/S12e/Gadd45 family protein [Fundicoccus culcitae]UUX34627.1 ribosomal L7Ae/L30e/S12e/Gadd45 family protein [Fundicoccus culcitae]